jgi:hypothetical protein
MECHFCGRPTTLLFGGMPICEECYQNAGSCCLEFGGNDLWQKREEEPEGDHPDFPGGEELGDQASLENPRPS